MLWWINYTKFRDVVVTNGTTSPDVVKSRHPVSIGIGECAG